jgi:glycosyltransferase involved in cell wall biosynthesis
MPTYNRSRLLVGSVKMVLAQTYGDFELIICDDGSTDDTLARLKEIDDPRVTVLSFANRGPPHPLNEIVQRARGEFFIILHDHDLFDPELIARSVAALDAFPEAHFVVQGSAWVAEDGVSHHRPNSLPLPPLTDGVAFGRSVLAHAGHQGFPIHACCMIRRRSFERVGFFYRPGAGWYADIDLSLRLLHLGPFAHIDTELFKFRVRDPDHALARDFSLTYNTLFSVFEEHIAIFFADDPSQQRTQLRAFSQARQSLLSRALLHALARGDVDGFRQALVVAGRDMPGGLRRFGVSVLARCPATHQPLAVLAKTLNAVRKRFRR